MRGLNEQFYHQTVTTQQIEAYLSQQIGRPLDGFFDQYLRTTQTPILEYFVKDGQLFARWSNVVGNFAMPVKVWIDEKEKWISPSTQWSTVAAVSNDPEIAPDRNFYIGSMRCY